MNMSVDLFVTPAKAGVQCIVIWIPAYAGMTDFFNNES